MIKYFSAVVIFIAGQGIFDETLFDQYVKKKSHENWR